MPRYLLHSQHIIEGALIETGEYVETDAIPTPNMEPCDTEALKRSRAAMPQDGAPGFVKQPWHEADWKVPEQPKPEKVEAQELPVEKDKK